MTKGSVKTCERLCAGSRRCVYWRRNLLMVLENVILVVTIHLRISIVGDSSVCRHDRHGLRNCLSKSNVSMPYGCLFCLQLRMKYQIQQQALRRVHTKTYSSGIINAVETRSAEENQCHKYDFNTEDLYMKLQTGASPEYLSVLLACTGRSGFPFAQPRRLRW